ncbi:dihydrofolate reductase family protein [Actinophytocola sp.]|uniref:dihydrofolate reductase family protein n=1 Tax=Actinophytocola sp. TaxID=1872138 RepID=UPI0039C8636C
MINRPYVLLSCAMSVDGYIDDAGPDRLVLSNDADWARVDEVRAGVDAILVGANTIRRDNPRLLVRSGKAHPVKVTITSTGDLDPAAQFFTTGEAAKLVYAPAGAAAGLTGAATVVETGPDIDLRWILADLRARGVRRLMVEGGGTVHTQFLTAGLVDELQLVVAPLFVGDPRAPRFVYSGRFGSGMTLAGAEPIGDLVLLRYFLGTAAADWRLLRTATELARCCPPSETAFSVGAVIVDAAGTELARGYSRDTDPTVHAEESALAKLSGPPPPGATLYSSLEPCSSRSSRPTTCTQHILDSGIRRVVIAWREPSTFVHGHGAELLAAGGVEVIEFPDLAPAAKEPNRHLL